MFQMECPCPIRTAYRSETNHDIRCEACGVVPGLMPLFTDVQDRWWCIEHHPDFPQRELEEGA